MWRGKRDLYAQRNLGYRKAQELFSDGENGRDGNYKEEIEWWGSVYDEMVASVKVNHCDLTERRLFALGQGSS